MRRHRSMLLDMTPFGLVSWATVAGFLAVAVAVFLRSEPGLAIRTASAWAAIYSMAYWWRDFLVSGGDLGWTLLMTLTVLGWVLYARVTQGLEATPVNPDWRLLAVFGLVWVVWTATGAYSEWISIAAMVVLGLSYYIGISEWVKL